jgi:phospholipase/carboxylesterase
MSGYLPLAETTGTERSDANQLTPIFLAHGTMDPVVPHQAGEMSRDALRALGYTVDWHDYPMPHSVCMEEVRDLNAWLLNVLN